MLCLCPVMPTKGSENESENCSCTTCIKDIPEHPSPGHQGANIGKILQGKYIPSKEKKLIEKLVRTRAVYDDVRKQLLSGSNVSILENANFKQSESSEESDDIERSSAILHLVDLVDKGVALEPHKLSECCSCCSCRAKGPRHAYKHKGRSIEISTKGRSKGSLLRRGVNFKAKHIRSDPCTCTLKLNELLKRPSKPKKKKANIEQANGLSETTDLGKYEMYVTNKEYMSESTEKRGRKFSKVVKHKIKGTVHSELTKSKERLRQASQLIKNRTKLMQTVYEKRAPISDLPDVTPQHHFSIKKDSITKYKENLKRKEKMKKYECEPECNPEQCVPEECFKLLKLKRKLRKNDNKIDKLEKTPAEKTRTEKTQPEKTQTEKTLGKKTQAEKTPPKKTHAEKMQSKKTHARSGHSLKRCLCPLKLKAVDMKSIEKENKSVGESPTRCFCLLKLQGQMLKNDITTPQTEDKSATMSTKATKTKRQKQNKKNGLDKLKREKRYQKQHKCVPGECDPYECLEKIKKRYGNEFGILGTACSFTQTLKTPQKISDLGIIETNHSKMISKSKLARTRIKQHQTSPNSQIARSGTQMTVNLNESRQAMRRSVKVCSSFSLSITITKSKSNPNMVKDTLQPVDRKYKIKRLLGYDNPTLKRCLCTLNLHNKKSKRLTAPNVYTVRQLVLDKTKWDKEALNVYRLNTLVPNNRYLSQKCRINFLDSHMQSYFQGKNQRCHRERSLLSCVVSSNVKNKEDFKHRFTFSDSACFNSSKGVSNTNLNNEEESFAITRYENKYIKSLERSDTSCNFSISRSDLTGISRLLKPCFCTMNINISNNNLLHPNKHIVSMSSELSSKMGICQDNLPTTINKGSSVIHSPTVPRSSIASGKKIGRYDLPSNRLQKLCWCPLRLQNIDNNRNPTHKDINHSTSLVHHRKKVMKSAEVSAGRHRSKQLLALRSFEYSPETFPPNKHVQTEKSGTEINNSKATFVTCRINKRKSKMYQIQSQFKEQQLKHHALNNSFQLKRKVVSVQSSLGLNLGLNSNKGHKLQSLINKNVCRKRNETNRDSHSHILMKQDFVEKIHYPNSQIKLLCTKHTSEKNIALHRPVQLRNSAIVSSQSFLKRCISALKSKDHKPRALDAQIRTNNLNREIITYHIQEQRTPKLLPYECEPGICVPGECDPLVCEQIIKRRNMRQDTKSAGTEKLKTKATSSNHNQIKSVKVKANQSKSEIKSLKKKQQTHHPPKRHHPAIKQQTQPVFRPPREDICLEDSRAVRIESCLNFSLEFSKAGGERPCKCEKKREPKITKPMALEGPKLSQHTSSDAIQTDTRRVGTELKRCFCTLKYNLAPVSAKPAVGIDKGITVHKRGRGVSKITTPEIKTNKHDVRQQTKAPYHLEPYECEPGICIPGECDPYECLKLIKKRNMKHKTHSTSTKPQETKSASSMAYSNADARCIMTQCTCGKPKCANRYMQSEPVEVELPMTPECTTNRAVRISSNIHFSIEFSKGGLPCQDEPPICIPPEAKPKKIKNVSESKTTKQELQQVTPLEVKSKKTKTKTVNLDSKKNKSKLSSVSLQTDNVKKESKSSALGSSLKRCFCTLKLQKVGKESEIPSKSKDLKGKVVKQTQMTSKVKDHNEITSRSVKTNTKKKNTNKKQTAKNTPNDIRIGPYLLQPHDMGGHGVSVSTKTKKEPTYQLEPYECEPGVCIPGECDPYECYERIKRRDKRDAVTEVPPKRHAGNYCDTIKCKSTGTQAGKDTLKCSELCQTDNCVCEKSHNRRRNAENRTVRINSNFNISIQFCKQGGDKVKSEKKRKASKPKIPIKSVSRPPPSKNVESQGDKVKREDKAIPAQNALKRCFCTLKLQEPKTKERKNEKVKQKKSITEVLPGSFATPQRYLFVKDAESPPNKQVGRGGKHKVVVNRVAVEETRRQYHESSSHHQVRSLTENNNIYCIDHKACEENHRTRHRSIEYSNSNGRFFNLRSDHNPQDVNEMETIYPYNPSKFKKRKSKTSLRESHFRDDSKIKKTSLLQIMCKHAYKSSRRLTAKQGSPSINSGSKLKYFGWHISLHRFKHFFSRPKNSSGTNKLKNNNENASSDTKPKESKYSSNILKNIFFNIVRCDRHSIESKVNTLEETKSFKAGVAKEELCKEYERCPYVDTIQNNEFAVLPCCNEFNDLVCNFCNIQCDKVKNVDMKENIPNSISHNTTKQYDCGNKINNMISNTADSVQNNKQIHNNPKLDSKIKTTIQETTGSNNDELILTQKQTEIKLDANINKTNVKYNPDVFLHPTESIFASNLNWFRRQPNHISNKTSLDLTTLHLKPDPQDIFKDKAKRATADFCPNNLSADNIIVDLKSHLFRKKHVANSKSIKKFNCYQPVLTVGFMKLHEDKKRKASIGMSNFGTPKGTSTTNPNQQNRSCTFNLSNLMGDNEINKKEKTERKRTKTNTRNNRLRVTKESGDQNFADQTVAEICPGDCYPGKPDPIGLKANKVTENPFSNNINTSKNKPHKLLDKKTKQSTKKDAVEESSNDSSPCKSEVNKQLVLSNEKEATDAKQPRKIKDKKAEKSSKKEAIAESNNYCNASKNEVNKQLMLSNEKETPDGKQPHKVIDKKAKKSLKHGPITEPNYCNACKDEMNKQLKVSNEKEILDAKQPPKDKKAKKSSKKEAIAESNNYCSACKNEMSKPLAVSNEKESPDAKQPHKVIDKKAKKSSKKEAIAEASNYCSACKNEMSKPLALPNEKESPDAKQPRKAIDKKNKKSSKKEVVAESCNYCSACKNETTKQPTLVKSDAKATPAENQLHDVSLKKAKKGKKKDDSAHSCDYCTACKNKIIEKEKNNTSLTECDAKEKAKTLPATEMSKKAKKKKKLATVKTMKDKADSLDESNDTEIAKKATANSPLQKSMPKESSKSGVKTSPTKLNANQKPKEESNFTKVINAKKLLNAKLDNSKRLISKFTEEKMPSVEETKQELLNAQMEKKINLNKTKNQLKMAKMRQKLQDEKMEKRLKESQAKQELKLNKRCVCGSQLCRKKYKEKVVQETIQSHLLSSWKCVCKSAICEKERQKSKLRNLPRSEKKQYVLDLKRKAAAEKRERKEIAERTRQYAKEKEEREKRLVKETAAWNKSAKKSADEPTSVLVSQSLIDFGKLGARTSLGLFRFVKRTVTDPKQALSAVRKDPLKFLGSIVGGNEAGATFSRIGQRIRSMKEIKSLREKIESTTFGNQIVNMANPARRKKVMMRPRRRKAPVAYECDMYMYTIRKKRCLAVYYMCPWFYPHCIGFLHLWKQFTDAILFLLAVCVWSPCILITEFCRACLCCAFCTG